MNRMYVKKKLFSFFKFWSRLLFGKNLGFIPGLRILHRAIFKSLRPNGIVHIEIFGRPFLIYSEDTGEGGDLLLYGIYSPFETALLRKLVKPGMTAVDIGAHIGYFTVMMADVVGDAGHVYAFEPEQRNFELLSKNIALNKFSNVSLYNMALLDKSGRRDLYLDASNLGNFSFAKENIPSVSVKGKVAVDTSTLDEVLPHVKVDFVKIDIQGAEALAISGGEKLLSYVKTMIIEFWPYGLRNFGSDPFSFLKKLLEKGFSIYVMDEARKMFKKTTPEKLIQVSNNRPQGKGWANVVCYRGDLDADIDNILTR